MGQCMKICEETFCLKMADSNSISCNSLNFEAFSRRRKMRHEQAHLMHLWNKLYELFLEDTLL